MNDEKSDIERIEAEDKKAELALLGALLGKSRQVKRALCREMDCPWEEYQRLEKKWARVLERLEKERREQCHTIIKP